MNLNKNAMNRLKEVCEKDSIEEFSREVVSLGGNYLESEPIILCLAIEAGARNIVSHIIDNNKNLKNLDWSKISSDYSLKVYFIDVKDHPIGLAFDNDHFEIAKILKSAGFPLYVEIDDKIRNRNTAIYSAIRFMSRHDDPRSIAMEIVDFMDDNVDNDIFKLIFNINPMNGLLYKIIEIVPLIYERITKRSIDYDEFFVNWVLLNNSISSLELIPYSAVVNISDKMMNSPNINGLKDCHFGFITNRKTQFSIQRCYLDLFMYEFRDKDFFQIIGEAKLDCFKEVIERGDPDVFMDEDFLEAAIIGINKIEILEYVLSHCTEKVESRLKEVISSDQFSGEVYREKVMAAEAIIASNKLRRACEQEPGVKKRNRLAM